MNLNKNELRLMLKIATLYYNEGLKQSDIALQLGLSQSQVSRALTRCVKDGLVKISVVPPADIFIHLEQELQSRYGFAQAVIVDIPDNPQEHQIRNAIGSAAAHYIQSTLQKNNLIGVSSWSETIRSMVDNMHPVPNKAQGVVQILGGVGQNGNLQATMLTHSLAKMLDCESFLLPATGIGQSIDDKNWLMRSGELLEVTNKFDLIDIAIIGIGSTTPSMLLRNSGNYYEEEMATKLIERGAVGDICLHYYAKDGSPILNEEEDHVISMSLQQLRQCPRVVALAGGADKVEAIKGALAGGYIDVLITDRVTAVGLLDA